MNYTPVEKQSANNICLRISDFCILALFLFARSIPPIWLRVMTITSMSSLHLIYKQYSVTSKFRNVSRSTSVCTHFTTSLTVEHVRAHCTGVGTKLHQLLLLLLLPRCKAAPVLVGPAAASQPTYRDNSTPLRMHVQPPNFRVACRPDCGSPTYSVV